MDLRTNATSVESLDLPTPEMALKNADPNVLRLVIDASKKAGNEAYRQKRYQEAIEYYTQAVAGDPKDSTLFSNRSAAYLALGLLEQALWDAESAVALNPSWSKSYYRLGCAAMALNRWDVAVKALHQGLYHAKENEINDLQLRLKEAEGRLTKLEGLRRAAAATERRGLVLRLRDARRKDQALAMLNQFKQSMTAPDWELEDLEWRPTWAPSMRLATRDATNNTQQNTQQSPEPSSALVAYITALSDLAAPKAALRILADTVRLTAYYNAIKKLCTAKPYRITSALVISAGGGALPILAAKALSLCNNEDVQVVAFERSKMMYRMARQVLEANADGLREGVSVNIVPQPMQSFLSQQETKLFQNNANELLLITDLMDHTALGMGLLSTLEQVKQLIGRLKPLLKTVTIIPSRIRLKAMLVQLKLPHRTCGFDLSALDAAYRWYPGDERVDLAELINKNGMQGSRAKPLSEPFEVTTLDLQARLESEDCSTSCSDNWEEDFEINVTVTEAGWWNAVVFWFDLDLDGESSVSSLYPSDRSGSDRSSWGQALQYIDGREVSTGSVKGIRVRRDVGQIVFTPVDIPSVRLRHAFAPRWHYDMVQDESRNAAYDRAITRAVERCRQRHGYQKTDKVSVLDMGAGTGLLSMMAARAGADEVYAAEVSGHMCDVAEDVTIANGFLGKILVLDRDVRRMDVYRKPDGTAPELPRKVDLAIFELFDNGLLGEGVLHCLAAARAKLLTPDAILVPAEATVYAQPIEWCSLPQELEGVRLRFLQRGWLSTCAGGEYEGVDLRGRVQEWVALAEPQQVFTFNFYDIVGPASLKPEATALNFSATTSGVCNAVAMWFTLQLDDETMISTSPWLGSTLGCDEGNQTTWQPAVQWLGNGGVEVSAGKSFTVMAEHDTYSIKFTVPGDTSRQTDPAWMAQYQALQPVNAQLVKACVQNPLEFRSAALAAVAFAARPHDVGLDASQAVEFCTRMMG